MSVVRFKNGRTLLEDLEHLTAAAKAGEIIGLVGFTVAASGQMASINTDHAMIDNGTLAYASVLLSRQVADDSDHE